MLMIIMSVFLTGCNNDEESAKDTASNNESEKVSAEVDNNAQKQLQDLGFVVFNEPTDVPSFKVPGTTSGEFSSEELKGKLTILNFWAPWCNPCRMEMPHLEKFYNEFKNEKDFQLIATAVRTDSATVNAFMKDNNYSFKTYIDENISSVGIFISQGIPTSYIVNKDGKIIAGYVGPYDFNSEAFKTALKGLLK